MSGSYEFLDHPADVGFAARGATLEECFAAAAGALNDFGWEAERVEPAEGLEVCARAATLEDLMFTWLSDLLYLSDGEQRMFRSFRVARVAKQDDGHWRIDAVAQGERFDEARHRARTCIKAVTYHQLSVRENSAGWEATVFIDV